MLSAKQLSIAINKNILLKNIDLDIKPGEVTILLGCNGSGKSTLLHTMAGDFSQNFQTDSINWSQSGSCQLDYQMLSQYQAQQLARRRAVVVQRLDRVFGFNAREFVKLGRYPYQNKKSFRLFTFNSHQATDAKLLEYENHVVEKALEIADASYYADCAITTLSGGEFARVQFARALAQLWPDDISDYQNNKQTNSLLNRPYLLLDEPTAALDLSQQHRLLAAASMLSKKWVMGVFAIVHDINLAVCYADNLAWLKAGKIIASGPARSNFNAQLIAEVLGYPVDIVLRENLEPIAIPKKWVTSSLKTSFIP